METTKTLLFAAAALLSVEAVEASTLNFSDSATGVTGLVAAPAPFTNNVVKRQDVDGVSFLIEGLASGAIASFARRTVWTLAGAAMA